MKPLAPSVQGDARPTSAAAAGPAPSLPRRHHHAGFTMVEIAICIAVVAFALVAIIGVLPTGLQVQRQNREDTIIAQEGKFWLEAIRSGSVGLDYLTNHVDQIVVNTLTNRLGSGGAWRSNAYGYYGYSAGQGFRTGRDILGLLSLPQYYQWGPTNARVELQAVNTTAYVRALTGSAAEKTTGTNDFAFSYRLRPEIVRFSAITGMSTNLNEAGLTPTDKQVRLDALLRGGALMANLYELRLTVDWPVYRRGNRLEVGGNRKVFRTLVGGSMVVTNVAYLDDRYLMFLQPSEFVVP